MCILRPLCTDMRYGEDTWLTNVRKELSRIDLNDMWNVEKVNNDIFIIIKECHGRIKLTSKGSFYQHILTVLNY